MLLLFEFCDFFLPAFGQPCVQKKWLPYRPKWRSPERSFVWSICPCCHRIFVVLTRHEAVTAPWSVQPNRHVEETTQVGGGKGLTVCLCKRPHEGERVTGQLSHNTLPTAHAHNGTWPTSKKPLCDCRTTRASVVNGVLRF